MRPHRGQFAANEAADIEAVVGRQSLRRVFVAVSLLAGPGESIRRFQRAGSARRDQRVAIRHVQLRLPLTSRRLGLDFTRLRQRREQRLRLGDLRHFRGR